MECHKDLTHIADTLKKETSEGYKTKAEGKTRKK